MRSSVLSPLAASLHLEIEMASDTITIAVPISGEVADGLVVRLAPLTELQDEFPDSFDQWTDTVGQHILFVRGRDGVVSALGQMIVSAISNA